MKSKAPEVLSISYWHMQTNANTVASKHGLRHHCAVNKKSLQRKAAAIECLYKNFIKRLNGIGQTLSSILVGGGSPGRQ